MASTFLGLNIGKSGLYAYQIGINTTGHNITNAETDGYSRQVMMQRAANALKTNCSYGMLGAGVDVLSINQIRNSYLDQKFTSNVNILGNYSTKSYYMTEIENHFNEVSVEGFTTNFNKMFDNLQELTKNPADGTIRTQITNYAENLTKYFNSLSTSLSSIQEECNGEVKNQVDRINSLGQQISALTKQINGVEITGSIANDLRDQRALLVDELSTIANVSVSENVVGNSVGVTSYVVKINGQTLVDTNEFNTLKVVPRKEKANQNDIDGLYDIQWSNGASFNATAGNVSGSLKAVLEVRDGNNNENLAGKVTGTAGSNKLTLTQANTNKIEKLNIPERGVITVGNVEYTYEGFQVTEDIDGNFTYEFDLGATTLAGDINGSAKIGDSVDYKGIPYYMAQMNEFVRTFANAYNDVCRTGKDMNGDAGMDFFTGNHKATGEQFVFGPYQGSDDEATYDKKVFSSNTGAYAGNNSKYQSYYNLTVSNFSVNEEIKKDNNKVVTSSNTTDGVENKDVLEKLVALKTDRTMFKQGTPSSFFQTLVADIGVDAKTAADFQKSQKNICASIENQRFSVSGVDLDEEGMNLIRYQNAYNMSAKVISVMDEMYDKLINYMAN